jgi:hypothetical protein
LYRHFSQSKIEGRTIGISLIRNAWHNYHKAGNCNANTREISPRERQNLRSTIVRRPEIALEITRKRSSIIKREERELSLHRWMKSSISQRPHGDRTFPPALRHVISIDTIPCSGND